MGNGEIVTFVLIWHFAMRFEHKTFLDILFLYYSPLIAPTLSDNAKSKLCEYFET